MTSILNQLAHSTLLPDDLAVAILAGNAPPLEEMLTAVLISVQDANAVLVNDPESSPTERRIARMVLAVAFLSAMAVVGEAQGAM